MTTDWKKVTEQLAAHRNHSKNLPDGAKPLHSMLFTKDEIEKLLNQKKDGTQLDGIRVYLGADNVDGHHIVTTMHAVACEKTADGDFTDFKIEEHLPSADAIALTAAAPLLGGGIPCPPQCHPKKNFLNS